MSGATVCAECCVGCVSGAFGTFETGPPWAKAESGRPLRVRSGVIPFGIAAGLPGSGGKECLSGRDWRSGMPPWCTAEMVGLACDPGNCAWSAASLAAIAAGSVAASAR